MLFCAARLMYNACFVHIMPTKHECGEGPAHLDRGAHFVELKVEEKYNGRMTASTFDSDFEPYITSTYFLYSAHVAFASGISLAIYPLFSFLFYKSPAFWG